MEAENKTLLPQTIVKDEKKSSIARKIMPFALVLALISLGFLVSYNTSSKSKSTVVTPDTTLLKEVKEVRSSDTIFIKTAYTFNPTPNNLHPTHKPTEEKRMLKHSTHKPTHNKGPTHKPTSDKPTKPTHKPTKGNPTYTSQPTTKGFVDDETYNPTPVDIHPTKKPTDDLVLKKQMHN